MPNSPSKTLDGLAAELRGIADYLLENRSYLGMKDLNKARSNLKNLKTAIAGKISGKQKQNFNSNMEEVEDILDALIRQIHRDKDVTTSFTKDVRALNRGLYAVASLLSISAFIFSLHPPQ